MNVRVNERARTSLFVHRLTWMCGVWVGAGTDDAPSSVSRKTDSRLDVDDVVG